ncbi:MAG: GNAT family N-acetyltransferase [Flavobacteriaceae bacterium]
MSNFLLENETSKRLAYRKVLRSDFDDWLPFYHNPQSTKYWNGLPSNPITACNEQFDQIFERYDKNLGGMNALILKETKELIGLCGLLVQNVDNTKELEIGYSILPEFWLQGFAFEAAHKCKTHAFKNSFASSLISIIHVDNIPSQKVAEKNGMQLDNTTTYKDNPVHIFRVNQG